MYRTLVVVLDTSLLLVPSTAPAAASATTAATIVFIVATATEARSLVVSPAFLRLVFLIIVLDFHVVHVADDARDAIIFQNKPIGMILLAPRIREGIKDVLPDLGIIDLRFVARESISELAESLDTVGMISARSTSRFLTILVVADVLNENVSRSWVASKMLHESLSFSLEPVHGALVGCDVADLILPLRSGDGVKHVLKLAPLVANLEVHTVGCLVKLVEDVEQRFDAVGGLEDGHVSLPGGTLVGVALQASFPKGSRVQCGLVGDAGVDRHCRVAFVVPQEVGEVITVLYPVGNTDI